MSSESEKASDENQNQSEKEPKHDSEKYGFYLYPHRRMNYEPSLFNKMFDLTKNYEHCKFKCEEKVVEAFKKSPMVKIFIGALKKHGCPVDLRRHIVCEDCDSRVTGGYDSEFNQIVVCQNSRKSRQNPDVVLIHELTHMYDYCINKIDFKNLEHLACTEIRAANFAHCSFISSFLLNQSGPFQIKNTHQYCVKMKAAQSLMMARNIDFPTAMEAILKVFDKCYKDLEPIGRRIRRNSLDSVMALREAEHFGYC